jgi:hypothetical protein
MRARETLDLANRRRIHRPVGGCRPRPQGHRNDAAGPQERGKFSEGAGSVIGRNMLPDRRKSDEIEGQREPVNLVERRKPVIKPANAGAPGTFAQRSKTRSGLHRDNFEAEPREPTRIPARPGADVERRAAIRKEMPHVSEHSTRRQGIIAFGQPTRGVVLCSNNLIVARRHTTPARCITADTSQANHGAPSTRATPGWPSAARRLLGLIERSKRLEPGANSCPCTGK